MNLLEAKGGGVEYIETFPNELIYLNKVIGNKSTEEQLKAVEGFLDDREPLFSAINMAYIFRQLGDVDTLEKLADFKSGMNLLLMDIQFALGAVPKKTRGALNSPYV